MKKVVLAILMLTSLITSAQNVGIGTTTPQAKLHVKADADVETLVETETANSSATLSLRTNANSSNNIRLRKWAAGATGSTYGIPVDNLSTLIAAAQAGGFMIGTESNNNLYFLTGGNERLRIMGNGNIGINNNDPLCALDIRNVNSNGVTVYAANTNIVGNTQAIVATIASPIGGAVWGVSTDGSFLPADNTYHCVIGSTNNGGIGVAGYAENGNSIAVRARAGTGIALHSTGRLRFQSIGEAAGKVLTSDADGFATWQTLPSVNNIWSTDGISAYSSLPGNIGIGTNTPGAKLELNHNTNTSLSLLLNDSSATGSGSLRFRNRQTSRFMEFGGYVAADGHSANYHLDIQTDSTFIATFKGNGNVGIGMAIPSERLDVYGNIKATGNLMLNGGVSFNGPLTTSGYLGNTGQVLVSNGNAAPTWENAANPNVGFKAELVAQQSIPHQTNVQLTGWNNHFADGGGFNAATGVYTIPSDGLYFIGIKADFSSPASGTPSVAIRLYKNGSYFDQVTALFPAKVGYGHNVVFSYVGKFSAGDQLQAGVYQDSGTTMNIVGSGFTYFYGYKIY